jgi:hypothetical protein
MEISTDNECISVDQPNLPQSINQLRNDIEIMVDHENVASELAATLGPTGSFGGGFNKRKRRARPMTAVISPSSGRNFNSTQGY